MCGSSPRLWGTRWYQHHDGPQPRFIPTPVGNTSSGDAFLHTSSVHPHACGEHLWQWYAATLRAGSSPRLWGTLNYGQSPSVGVRFIPTPVGNTGSGRPRHGAMTVHPHACGEHVDSADIAKEPCGSSPRLWGTRGHHGLAVHSARFIPTPVGNTASFPVRPNPSAVHPHACGEHPTGGAMLSDRSGSSPRLWGTQRHAWVAAANGRFIPTPVGNTIWTDVRQRRPPVHPHACGEHACSLRVAHRQLRFIPTPVGNTR
ncbi:MAG: hypothetical protein DESF_01487 [Desulfovibrio sp.]